jgi:hypothetical protein
MKKSILCLFLYSLLASCAVGDISIPDKQKQTVTDQNNTLSKVYLPNLNVFTHEGCEYIIVGSGNWALMSHKGNCKSPIHHNTSVRFSEPSGQYIDMPEEPISAGDSLQVLRVTKDTIYLGFRHS